MSSNSALPPFQAGGITSTSAGHPQVSSATNKSGKNHQLLAMNVPSQNFNSTLQNPGSAQQQKYQSQAQPKKFGALI